MENEESNMKDYNSGSDNEGNRSFEAVHSDDLENEMNYSDEEPSKKEKVQKKARKNKQNARIFKQEVDVNVQKINLATLQDAAELATGDPVFCNQCQAIFNYQSKAEEIIKTEDNEEE
jgi:hypothetical protein